MSWPSDSVEAMMIFMFSLSQYSGRSEQHNNRLDSMISEVFSNLIGSVIL